MKQTKRMLGLLLALVLVAAMCVCPVSAAEGEKTVTVRVELMDSTLIPPTEVTMPATHQTFADFGMLETDPGFDTPIHALAQYLVQEGYSEAEDVYEILEVSYSNLSSILYTYANGDAAPDSSHFYMFMVNDQYPTPEGSSYGYNMADCPISDGDEIVVYAMNYPNTAFYAYFETQSLTVEAGEPASLRLMGQSVFGGTGAPVSGASLILSSDGASPTIPSGITTAADGSAQVAFDTPGVYTVSASRADISRPSATITVTASDPDADAQYVQADLAALTVPSRTKTDLTLPTIGKSGKTAVSWTSDKPDVIAADGKVTRGETDQTVTLTAVVKKAGASETRTFQVLVPAASAAPASLKEIVPSAGMLDFSADVKSYLVKLPIGVADVTLTPQSSDGSDVTVTGGAADGKGGYVAKPGETLAFAAEDGVSYTVAVASATALDAEWPQYRGAASGTTGAETARSEKEASLKWAAALKDASAWETGVSDPLLIDGKTYLAVGKNLFVLDENGKTVQSAVLAAPIGYTSRPVYADGLIFVPIAGGAVEALSADTLTPVWVSADYQTKEDGEAHQSLSSLLYQDGKLYGATAAADWTSSYDGVVFCLDAQTGETVWTYTPGGTGYYWAGAAMVNGAIVIGDDKGDLVSLDPNTGALLDKWNAGARIRSTVVADGGRAFVVSADGKLHRIAVGKDGKFGSVSSVSFAASSTSSPSILDGVLYVGGAQSAEKNYAGAVCAIDAETMQVTARAELPADVKSAPVVSKVKGKPYAYVTSNTTPGALYVFDSAAGTAKAVYTPSGMQENYCMASPIAGADGTLYYTNDSGTLFAIRSSVKDEETPSSSGSSSEESNSSNPSSESENPSSDLSSGGESSAASASESQPKTGDAAPILLYGMLLLAAALCGLVLLRIRSLRKES